MAVQTRTRRSIFRTNMRYTFKRLLAGQATLFAVFGMLRLLRHDLNNGMWSFAVAFALILGMLPSWLTEPTKREAKPENYHISS